MLSQSKKVTVEYVPEGEKSWTWEEVTASSKPQEEKGWTWEEVTAAPVSDEPQENGIGFSDYAVEGLKNIGRQVLGFPGELVRLPETIARAAGQTSVEGLGSVPQTVKQPPSALEGETRALPIDAETLRNAIRQNRFLSQTILGPIAEATPAPEALQTLSGMTTADALGTLPAFGAGGVIRGAAGQAIPKVAVGGISAQSAGALPEAVAAYRSAPPEQKTQAGVDLAFTTAMALMPGATLRNDSRVGRLEMPDTDYAVRREADYAKAQAERVALLEREAESAVPQPVPQPQASVEVAPVPQRPLTENQVRITAESLARSIGARLVFDKKKSQKGKQDAIQVQSPAAVPVQPAPEVSAEVGGQVRSAVEVTGAEPSAGGAPSAAGGRPSPAQVLLKPAPEGSIVELTDLGNGQRWFEIKQGEFTPATGRAYKPGQRISETQLREAGYEPPKAAEATSVAPDIETLARKAADPNAGRFTDAENAVLGGLTPEARKTYLARVRELRSGAQPISPTVPGVTPKPVEPMAPTTEPRPVETVGEPKPNTAAVFGNWENGFSAVTKDTSGKWRETAFATGETEGGASTTTPSPWAHNVFDTWQEAVDAASKSGGYVGRELPTKPKPKEVTPDAEVPQAKGQEVAPTAESPSLKTAVKIAERVDPANIGSLMQAFRQAHKAGYEGMDAMRAAWSLYAASSENAAIKSFTEFKDSYAAALEVQMRVVHNELSEASAGGQALAVGKVERPTIARPSTTPVTGEKGARETATPAGVTKAEVSKQPWEMTRSEWNESTAREYDESARMDSGKAEQLSGTLKSTFESLAKSKTRIASELRAGTYKLRAGSSGPNHKASVATALREGKPVPPEVLADYPDLKPAAPAPAAEAARQTEPVSVESDLPLRASDKSVRDITVSGSRKGDVITMSTKRGPKFTFVSLKSSR